ncbi:hypothetical protein [Brevibacterium senegalense]|uniref:hypothetical protein n=1 Tax=Brevibacterium senegalense TaxID=1033736 RepID=UPI0011CBE218|nr:hypothetical protein [Brevibacterium senegalense]
MEKEFRKVRPHVIERWFETLERDGVVVFRMSLMKTALFAATSWAFVVGIVMMFRVTPLATWNLFDTAGQGAVLPFLFGLLMAAGLLLFAVGCVMWTVVFPVVRPRLAVSWWGIQSVAWKPGGLFTLFAAPWPAIMVVHGYHTATRWPFPDTLHVQVSARGHSVERARPVRVRSHGTVVDYQVNGQLRGRKREILAFLLRVHAAVRPVE